MYAMLQANYLGEYVAVHGERVVDHDRDVVQLEQRVIERFGDIEILIAPITTSSHHELRHVSFKLVPLA